MYSRILWAYCILGIGLLACDEDEFIPSVNNDVTQVSYFSASTSILEELDSATIQIKLDKLSQIEGEIEISAESDAIYGTHYITIPALVDDKLFIDIEKGDSLVSFDIVALTKVPENASSIDFKISNVSMGFQKGLNHTHTIDLPITDQEPEQELLEVNFSDNFVHISENEAAPFEISIDISGEVTQSNQIKVLIEAPVGIEYGTRYKTLPDAVMNEITLDIVPGASKVNFSVVPINDQIQSEDYDLNFKLTATDQIQVGSQSQLQVRVQEDDITNSVLNTIASLRSKFNEYENQFWITEEYFIEGVITSANNVSDLKHAYIQDSTGGILLRFITEKKLSLGDKVKLNLKGASGSIMNGQKGIENVTDLSGILIERNVWVEPVVITTDQLHTGMYEGMKVRINNVSFVDAGAGITFKGTKRIQSETSGAMVMTSENAPFANVLLPEGNISIIGIVGDWGYLMPQKLNHDIIK